MDENLNAALNSLDMLATVTNARREYLAERRLHNICSQFSCVPLWRASISNGVPTKENNKVAFENAILCCGPRSRMTEKFSSSRNRPRSRGLPYDIRRKPFHHGLNNSTTSSTTTNGTRGGHIQFPSSSSSSVHYSTAAHLFESPHELKSKTEKFPVPHHLHLFRSKSLEDLRDTSSSSSAAAASKSPASTNTQGLNNLNNFIDFEPRGLNLCHTTSNLINNNTNNFKTEIESMSMRIEKLDVA